jgi:capsular exopolysaccharide synthesis family protein
MASGRNSKELIQWQQRSFFAESFRHVMASLLREDGHGKAPHTLLLTSPNPSEGKSTICGNLAICLAETGRRVLIIDADFRRPRIHSMFKLRNDVGLAQILDNWDDGKLPHEFDGILATKYPNLSALVNGPEVSDLSRILYSDRFPKLLAQLRRRYDFILIDAPPILQIADTRVLDRFADGVLLVLRSGVTDRKSALEAYRYLHEDGANIVGTVLNDWQPSRKRTDTYYGYVRRDNDNNNPSQPATAPSGVEPVTVFQPAERNAGTYPG